MTESQNYEKNIIPLQNHKNYEFYKIQQQNHPHPKHRAGTGPHETGEDRLTAVQGVAAALDVVKDLRDNRDRGDPHQPAPIAGGDVWTEQPFSAFSPSSAW